MALSVVSCDLDDLGGFHEFTMGTSTGFTPWLFNIAMENGPFIEVYL
jgi:hypothetical protein